MKGAYLVLDALVAGIWGITIIELLVLSDYFDFISDGVKFIFAVAGLIYLVAIKIPHELKMNRLKRKEKIEQVEKLKRDNKKYDS